MDIEIRPWPTLNHYWLVHVGSTCVGCITRGELNSNHTTYFHSYAPYDRLDLDIKYRTTKVIDEFLLLANITQRLTR